jgi:galactan endo-1,6-beta-galactosidase
MLLNHNPSGSATGSGFSDNLQPWNQANHSWYMAAVAAHARDVWGVAFSSLELFNEPVADWWHSAGTQEGCHFDPGTQAAVLTTLPAALQHFGLYGSSLRVAASDESYVDMALATWQALGPDAQAVIEQVTELRAVVASCDASYDWMTDA